MIDPVFVIHGVGNRRRSDFEAQVQALAKQMPAAPFDFRPIYWGDLAARDKWIDRTIPTWHRGRSDKHKFELRDAEATLLDTEGQMVTSRRASPPTFGIRSQFDTAILSASNRGLQSSPHETRDDEQLGLEHAEFVRTEIAELLPATRVLRNVNERHVLWTVGVALGHQLEQADIAGHELRGDAVRARSREVLRRGLADLDRVVGAACNAAAARVNFSCARCYGARSRSIPRRRPGLPATQARDTRSSTSSDRTR